MVRPNFHSSTQSIQDIFFRKIHVITVKHLNRYPINRFWIVFSNSLDSFPHSFNRHKNPVIQINAISTLSFGRNYSNYPYIKVTYSHRLTNRSTFSKKFSPNRLSQDCHLSSRCPFTWTKRSTIGYFPTSCSQIA